MPSDARREVHWEWSAHPVIAGRRSWVTELLDMVGADNVYADLDVERVRVRYEEAAIRRQPDVVVACWCGVRRLPTWSGSWRRPRLAGHARLSARAGWRC